MRWTVAAAIVSLILLAGCTQLGGAPEDARQHYEQLVRQSESSTFHITYDIDIGTAERGELGIIDTMELYNYRGKAKSEVTASMYTISTTATSYRFDNTTVTCTEGGSSFGLSGDDGPDCSIEESSLDFSQQFRDDLEGYNLSYVGTDRVADRPCSKFSITQQAAAPADEGGLGGMGSTEDSTTSPISHTLGTDTADEDESDVFGENANLSIKVCIDNQKGYLASLDANVTQRSAFGGSQDVFVRMKVTDHSSDVSEEDVAVPISLAVSASCRDQPHVSITPLKDLGEVTLSVNDQNQTVDLGGGTRHVNLSEDRLVDGTNEIRVYHSDGVGRASCYYYTTDFDTDYDYNYTSGTDYNYSTDQYGFQYRTSATTNYLDEGYTVIEGRIENGDFSEAEMLSDREVDIEGWHDRDGDTNYVKLVTDGIDGNSIGTGWEENSYLPDPASISQDVNLTGVEAIGLDVAGRGQSPYRSEITLYVDGEKVGTFIEAPQRNTTYEGLGVAVEDIYGDPYTGYHELSIKWEHIDGDNLGGAIIDNVRAYR